MLTTLLTFCYKGNKTYYVIFFKKIVSILFTRMNKISKTMNTSDFSIIFLRAAIYLNSAQRSDVCERQKN